MFRLRLYLIALLIFIGFALNVERLDIGAQQDVINLASFVYVLAGAAVVSTIMVPSRWKVSTRNVVIFWVVIYLVFKVVIFNDRPIIGGLHTYVTIVELLILVEVVLLTRKVMENLQQLEETIANITLADVSSRVKSLDVAIPEVNKEFVRSRRYKHPLGIVVIKLKPENIQINSDVLSKDILRTMMSRYPMSNLIRAIDRELRRPDLILEQYKENRIILLLPEANIDAARTVSKTVQRVAETKIGSKVSVGVAAFPENAITFEELIDYAESKMTETVTDHLVGQSVVEQDVQTHNKATQK